MSVDSGYARPAPEEGGDTGARARSPQVYPIADSLPHNTFLRPVLHAVKLWQHPAYKSSPGLAEQALTALQQPTLLTGVVPAPEALGLTQGLRVPVHVALGALLLLWGYSNVLAPHVCPLGDVLRGTAGRGRLPDQLARAILIDAH